MGMALTHEGARSDVLISGRDHSLQQCDPRGQARILRGRGRLRDQRVRWVGLLGTSVVAGLCGVGTTRWRCRDTCSKCVVDVRFEAWST